MIPNCPETLAIAIVTLLMLYKEKHQEEDKRKDKEIIQTIKKWIKEDLHEFTIIRGKKMGEKEMYDLDLVDMEPREIKSFNERLGRLEKQLKEMSIVWRKPKEEEEEKRMERREIMTRAFKQKGRNRSTSIE